MTVRIVCGSTGPLGELVHAQRLAEHLHDRGLAVEVWALGGHDQTLPGPGSTPVRIVPVAAETAPGERAEQLASALRTGDPVDVVLVEDVVSGLAAAKLRETSPDLCVVRAIHHLDPAHDLDSQEAQRLSVASADRCVCVSRYWSERVADELGIDALVVANGVDHARFAAPQLDRQAARAALGWGDRCVVLSVGGIGARKGSATLLEAFARARGRMGEDPLLAIVGGPPPPKSYLDRFLDDAARLGLVVGRGRADPAGSVLLMETQREDAMPGVYRAAHAFALPSTREGFGLAALEAAASGLPIVLSDLAVFRESFRDDHDCLMVPVGDSGPLAEALVRSVRDDELRRRLGSAAQATASAYTWSAAAEAYVGMFRELRSR